jgi:hypothetical protein
MVLGAPVHRRGAIQRNKMNGDGGGISNGLEVDGEAEISPSGRKTITLAHRANGREESFAPGLHQFILVTLAVVLPSVDGNIGCRLIH